MKKLILAMVAMLPFTASSMNYEWGVNSSCTAVISNTDPISNGHAFVFNDKEVHFKIQGKDLRNEGANSGYTLSVNGQLMRVDISYQGWGTNLLPLSKEANLFIYKELVKGESLKVSWSDGTRVINLMPAKVGELMKELSSCKVM